MTSNLDDLPVSNQADKNNVTLNTSEKNQIIENPINTIKEQRENDLKETNKNEQNINLNDFVTSIQNAVSNGTLNLPSRDIPQNQNHLTQDENIQQNFIPGNSEDYIEQDINKNNIINEYIKNEKVNNKTDEIYNQLQTPILLSVLYFIFQLPVIKNLFLKIFPFFYHKDGNLNLNGFIANSFLFATSYYLINYLIDYFSI